ncbi:AtpZ/AtpI family protein [Pedobacter sp. L105]|uniref:AtpZ/AtpI family protein n=1 Tax=Pedobacter sp. L105 TaxID=1641871 RepID=UPI00131C6762|nr:AtpZ/AtpI family protein [Pedobacter sp. L105]
MSDQQKGKGKNNFAAYSGMGFQMLAIIGVFTFAGYKIDAHRNTHKPIFTALLGVIGVVISLYQVIKQLSSKD